MRKSACMVLSSSEVRCCSSVAIIELNSVLTTLSDGEWISEVVDDRLALRHSGDERNYVTEYLLRVNGDKNVLTTPLSEMAYGIQTLEKEFRESLRKGSNALYFASCKDSNETWLPLLEKAYAKAHGDYQAIEGGFAGEGIEDLTG